LRFVVHRGIIRDGFAPEIDWRFPTWHSRAMDCWGPCNLQRPVLGAYVQSPGDRCPTRHPAPGSALVGNQPAPCLQAMWHRGLCEHRAELAWQNWRCCALHEALDNV